MDVQNHVTVCPDCGTCPACGRGGNRAPMQPYVPPVTIPWHPYPVYPPPTTTIPWPMTTTPVWVNTC